jgi:hypothetical protein
MRVLALCMETVKMYLERSLVFAGSLLGSTLVLCVCDGLISFCVAGHYDVYIDGRGPYVGQATQHL